MILPRRPDGFTIVELLIVIVVIAILAAISIVAYNGIQQRGGNAQRIAAARDWVNAIKSYVVVNQGYPSSSSGGTFCIGTSNATNLDANPDVDCGITGNIKHDAVVATPAFNNAILTILSSLPRFPADSVLLTSSSVSGMLFRGTDTFDPTGKNIASYPTLIFALNGSDQDCVLRPLATPGEGGNFTAVSTKNSGSYASGTLCRVILPDPTSL